MGSLIDPTLFTERKNQPMTKTIQFFNLLYRFIFQLTSKKYQKVHPIISRIHDAVSWTLFLTGVITFFISIGKIEGAPATATFMDMIKEALPYASVSFLLLFSFAKYNQDDMTWEN